MPTYVSINNNQLNYLYTENKNTYLPPDHLLCSRTLLQVLHLLINPCKPMPNILLLYRWEKRIQERGDYKLLIQTWLSNPCFFHVQSKCTIIVLLLLKLANYTEKAMAPHSSKLQEMVRDRESWPAEVYRSQTTNNCFTMLCCFLLYNNVNQL